MLGEDLNWAIYPPEEIGMAILQTVPLSCNHAGATKATLFYTNIQVLEKKPRLLILVGISF